MATYRTINADEQAELDRDAFERETRAMALAPCIKARDAAAAAAGSVFVPVDDVERIEKMFANAETVIALSMEAYDARAARAAD